MNEEREEQIVYRSKASGDEVMRFIKAIGFPVITLILGIFTVNIFGVFGARLVTPLFAACWGISVLTGIIMPSHRTDSIEKAEKFLCGYFASLLALRFLNAKVSGVSAEMLMATYNEIMPAATGNAMVGFVQSMLWLVTVMAPIGFLTYQGKRIIDFKRNKSKVKMFERTRSIRSTKSD